MKKIILLLPICLIIQKTIAQNKPNSNNTGQPGIEVVHTTSDISGPIKMNVVNVLIPKLPVKTEAEINTISNQVNNSNYHTIYSDGLGRNQQIQNRRIVSNGKDMIKTYVYDADGRVSIDPLPYGKSEPGNGYIRNSESQLRNFYNQMGYPGENYLYQKQITEKSPIKRILEKRAAGNSWVGMEKGQTSGVEFLNNTNLLKIELALTAPYLPIVAGTLNKVFEISEKDEDAGTSGIKRKYINCIGQTLCTLAYNTINNQALYTYFVYDQYGQLRYTITPKASAAIMLNNNTISSDILEKLCFRRDYDDLGRMIATKKPETSPTYFVYDQHDRVILSQDALMRQNNQWVFTKYDIAGRVHQTGVFTGTFIANQATTLDLDNGMTQVYPIGSTVPYTRTLLQNQINNQTLSDPFLLYLLNKPIQEYSQLESNFGNAEITLNNIYDHNQLSNLPFGNVSGGNTEGYRLAKSNKTNGMLTGIIAKTSDNSGTVQQALYYNERGELIQKTTRGLNNMIRYQAYGYDFLGRLIKTLLRHDNQFVIYRKMSYDAYDRLIKIEHKINNASNYRPIARYYYDDLGRMSIRKLGGMGYNVNYEYNIRNWITGINKSFALNKNLIDYFGMEISYDKGFDKTYLNGSISGIKWRSKGSGGEQRAYGYEYDYAGRLTLGDYNQISENNPGNWLKTEKDFTNSHISYDENGNILTMKHMGIKSVNNIIVLDDLIYTYGTNSNRLLGIEESNASQSKDPLIHDGLADFRNMGGAAATDYGFDANGNRSSDQNKEITQINNNWIGLNKPLMVEFANNNKIEYVYDALGTLIRKKITQTLNNKITVYDYVDEVTYKNGSLEGIMHEEGRIRVNSADNTYAYDYFIKDHLENVRAIITETQVNTWGGTTPLSQITYPTQPYNGSTTEGTLNNDNSYITTGDGNPTTPFLYLATSEVPYDTLEEEFFDNLDETRSTRPLSNDSSNLNAARLAPSEGKILGPGIMLEVMAGDQIQLGMEALFFSSSNPGNIIPLQNIVGSIIGALSGSGGLLDGVGAATQATSLDAASMTLAINQIQNGQKDTTKPDAFLNYLFFDESMRVVVEESGALQVTQANAWSSLEKPLFTMNRNGYLYVYSCNSSEGVVRTDNLYVSHYQGSLLEEFHYYPFGLCFEVSRSPVLEKSSDVKYNSQYIDQDEFEDAQGFTYGLDQYDFAARSYDPQTGRWLQEDPMMQHASPYLAMSNNPVSFTDPLGLNDDHIGVDKDGNIVRQSRAPGANEYSLLTPSGEGTYISEVISESEYILYRQIFYRSSITNGNISLNTESMNELDKMANYVAFNAAFDSYINTHPNEYSSSLEYVATMQLNSLKSVGTLNIVRTNNFSCQSTISFSTPAVSGSTTLRSINQGSWLVNHFRTRSTTPFVKYSIGFSFDIGPEGQFGRTLLRIHPDGGAPGTAGCIGLTGSAIELTKFMTILNNNLRFNNSIPLNVKINTL